MNIEKATFTNDIGDTQLRTVWNAPEVLTS
jgi:hypothetical protein